jgi:hypothetical protein
MPRLQPSRKCFDGYHRCVIRMHFLRFTNVQLVAGVERLRLSMAGRRHGWICHVCSRQTVGGSCRSHRQTPLWAPGDATAIAVAPGKNVLCRAGRCLRCSHKPAKAGHRIAVEISPEEVAWSLLLELWSSFSNGIASVPEVS